MILLVCGGRDFADWQLLKRTLAGIHSATPIDCLIHGGAKGADYLAGAWATNEGIPIMEFPANWQVYRKRAGPMRNAWMLKFGRPDLVVAFPGGRGTMNMVEQASRAKVEVRMAGLTGVAA